MKKNILNKLLFFISLRLAFTTSLKAQDVYEDISSNNSKSTVVIPFAFYLKSFGVAAAIDVASRGFLQKQSTSTLVGLISSNNSRYIYWQADNFQMPSVPRLFISPNINIANYGSLDIYNGKNPKFPKEIAGNNNSDKNNYFNIKSSKTEGELIFRYLLPIGYGKNHIINKIKLINGLPSSGMTTLSKGNNPIKNGRTFIESSFFFQDQKMTFSSFKKHIRHTGYSIGIKCENVDFKENPTKGINFYYKYWNSLDILNSTNSWNMHEMSISKYVSIPSKCARQQVLAFNIWTRNINSWNNFSTNKLGNKIYNRPSPFMGANLGGRYRFRAYPEARYNNASSLLYSAEYRVIPNWNPLKNWNILKKININIDWIQFVTFLETGKVSLDYDINKLHTNMKYDYGLGLRLFANQMVIRVDLGLSNEGSQVQMFIGQAF